MIADEYLMNFCRALADSARSGLSLNEAFRTLSKSRKYGGFIAGAAKLTAGGSALHEALKAQKIFPPVFIALIRAGEEGGKIEEFLVLFADCLEARIKFRRSIIRALVYPVFAVILIGSLFLLISFKAFPIILGPLLTLGIAMPKQMIWMNELSGYAQEYWLQIIAFIFILALLFRAFILSGPGRKIWAFAGHWFPGLKFLAKEARLYNIYTTMGLLLKAGVPLSAMMDILLQFSQDDILVHRHFLRMSVMVSKGKNFSESLAGFLPQEDLYNLEIAEKSGRLDEVLLRLGKAHYERHLHRLKLFVTGFKISSIIAITVLSFGLIMALIWPALSLLKGAQKDLFNQPDMTIFSQESAPANVSQEHKMPDYQDMEDRTTLFNEIQGGKIADLLQKSSGDSESEEAKTKKKLGAVSPIKTMQFKKIEPTSIKSSDIN